MPIPDNAYTAQEILEAYKEEVAIGGLQRRRLAARIAELEHANEALGKEVAALKSAGSKNGAANPVLVAAGAPMEAP